MSEVFTRYTELAREWKARNLVAAWHDLLALDIHHPWDGTALHGHVPFATFDEAYQTLHEAFSYKGLYVWGAGIGPAARLQYVGIAGIRSSDSDSRSLGARFKSRYVASASARKNPGDREINLAKAHSAAFASLPDDFNPRARRRPIDKYITAGIPVKHKLKTRPQRAERYVKVGLSSVWYSLIPAPPSTTGAELAELEASLIEIASADLFRAFARDEPASRPLLNIREVRDKNVHISASDAAAYYQWLRGCGSWWNRWPAGQYGADAQAQHLHR